MASEKKVLVSQIRIRFILVMANLKDCPDSDIPVGSRSGKKNIDFFLMTFTDKVFKKQKKMLDIVFIENFYLDQIYRIRIRANLLGRMNFNPKKKKVVFRHLVFFIKMYNFILVC